MAVRILIADDSEQVRSAITFLIRGLGWEVCGEAGDGEAVVEKAIELKPDLLILDIAMPKRDGWSAGCAIRASLPSTPILLYTLLPASYLENRAKQLGFQGVVEKSNPTALIAAVRRVLSAEDSDSSAPVH
jgi:DNA-binding NarL/FixJ family response regulator